LTTKPRAFLDRARRIRPTRQRARVMARFAAARRFPTTFGTLHLGWVTGGGGGGGSWAEPTEKAPFIKVACGSQTNV
jgi:hypothetical protein